jgi:hypothetical protein
VRALRNPFRRPSRQLTFDDAVQIWLRIFRGEFLNRIAADYDVNPGRVAEIKKEYRFQGSRDAALSRRAG